MKKRLTRDSFSALRETVIVLDEREQRAVKGGDYWDDHGYYTTDSSGNITWTRTSNADSNYYSSSSGYSSGSNYGSSSSSGSNYGETISRNIYDTWNGYWPGGYVEGLGYVAPDSGFTSGYNYESGSSYSGQGSRDCAIQAIAHATGKSLSDIHAVVSQVFQELYKYSETASDIFAGNGLTAREIEMVFTKVTGSCANNSYSNSNSSIVGIGLINGHVVSVQYYNNGGTVTYYDPQQGKIGTAQQSSFDYIITRNW